MWIKAAIFSSVMLIGVLSAPARAECVTDAEVDAAVGAQVRAGASTVNAPGLWDRPLCSGLTLAQAIQRIHAAAFPDEKVRAAAQEAALVAREQADRSARAAIERSDAGYGGTNSEYEANRATRDALNESAVGIPPKRGIRAKSHHRATAIKQPDTPRPAEAKAVHSSH